MIDLNKYKNEDEISINNEQEYLDAINTIGSKGTFIWNTDEGRKLLKLINEVCDYEKKI